MSIFTNFFRANPAVEVNTSEAQQQQLTRQEITAAQGIFGPIKEGTVRDFFCVDQHTWVWYEEWTEANGQRKRMTTRFDVRGGTVVKSQNGGEYSQLVGRELQNFNASAVAYVGKVKKSMYEQLLKLN